MPVVDHAAVLVELLTLVDERFQAAIRAGIADIERLNKVERMNIDTDFAAPGHPKWVAFDAGGNLTARGATIRECIDGVPE